MNVNSTTTAEKKRLFAVLRATEYLFVENMALKLVLVHFSIPNWRKLVEHLLADKELVADARSALADLYREIEASEDPSSALKTFFGTVPAENKA